MKNRRILVLVMSLLMVLSGFTTAFADTLSFQMPVTSNPRVDALVEAGLVKGDAGGLRLEDTITRAEAVTMIVRLLGKEDLATSMKSFPSMFTDMSTAHWANGNVNLAVAGGLINGYPDGTFKPSAQITNAEVTALLVRVMGDLTEEEKATAIWPTTYIIKGAQLGLFADVTIDNYNASAVRERMFEMVYNVVESFDPIANVVTVGNPVEAIVLENERVGNADENTVEVMVLKDQYSTAKEGLEEGDTFEIELDKVYFDGFELDSEGLLGKVLTVHFGEKETPVKIKLNTGYSYITGVLEDIDVDEVLISEKSYDVVLSGREDRQLALAIYNNEEMDFDEVGGFEDSVITGEFVRATIKNGDVLFIEAFDFRDIAPVVEVDDEDVIYVDNQRGGAERTLALDEDELEVILFSEDFAIGTLADIKADDMIHWFIDEDGDTVVVVMKKADIMISGIFEGISFDRSSDDEPVIEIDDEEITALVANGNFSPVYSVMVDDEEEHYALTMDYVKELEGFEDEEVTAYVDIFGNLQKLVGSEEVDVRFVAVITDVFYKEFELANGKGEVETYEAGRRTDFFSMNGSTVIDLTIDDFDEYDLVKVLVDGDVIKEMEKLTDSEDVITNITKDVVDFDGDYFYINRDTNVFVLDMADVEDSEVMSVADFLDIVDKTKLMEGYVVVDAKDGDVAEHIIMTEFSKKRAEDVVEIVAEVTRFRAVGSDYTMTVEDETGKTYSYTIEETAEVAKITDGTVKVGFIINLVLDEDTDEFVTMDVLLDDSAPVYRVDSVGRGGDRNLNYVVLEGASSSTRTIWLSSTADVFGSYREGSKVAIGDVDSYSTIDLLLVVADTKAVTGTWATADEIVIAEFEAMLEGLPALVDLTLADEADVVAVRAFYDGMTVAQQGMVVASDLTALGAYEAQILVLEGEEADALALQAFADAVADIPAVVGFADIALVEAARTLYDALDVELQGMVALADYNKMLDAEAVVVFVEAVDAIPATVQFADVALVTTARTEYDALSTAQLAMVATADVDMMLDAEAVVAFVTALDALPAMGDLVIGDAPAVEAVRTIYDGLTLGQQALVHADDLALLEAYEAQIVILTP